MKLSEATRELLAKELRRIDKELEEAAARHLSLKSQLDGCDAGIKTLEKKRAAIQKDLQ